MEITIQRVPKEKDYLVRIDDQFTITTTWAENDADVKAWLQNIQKLYRSRGAGKRRRRIVSLCAERSLSYANGRHISSWDKSGSHKEDPYELLQICIENHCLLCKLDAISIGWGETFNPKVLKDFIHDNRVTVVGVGIDKVEKRMEKDHGWVMPKLFELRDLAAQAEKAQNALKKGQITTTTDFSRFGIAKLARVVLGEEMNLVKPTKIKWWATPSEYPNHGTFLSDDLVKYATVEAFLVSKMGTKLILETTATTQY